MKNVFASIIIKDIGLWISLFLMPLYGSDIGVMLSLLNDLLNVSSGIFRMSFIQLIVVFIKCLVKVTSELMWT